MSATSGRSTSAPVAIPAHALSSLSSRLVSAVYKQPSSMSSLLTSANGWECMPIRRCNSNDASAAAHSLSRSSISRVSYDRADDGRSSQLSSSESTRGSGSFSETEKGTSLGRQDLQSQCSRKSLSMVSETSDAYLVQMLGDLHTQNIEYMQEDSERYGHLDDIYGFYSGDDESAMERNRAKALCEIVTTETTYVEMLTTLKEYVWTPLRIAATTKAKKVILSNDDITKLFCNLDDILNLHKTLLAGLEERYREGKSQTKISDIFTYTLPFMKMYIHYMHNYPTALEVLARATKTNGEFRKLLDITYKNHNFKGLNIISFLILPIQRIPRYILLLEQLLNYTQPDHVDYCGLMTSVMEVKKIAMHINDSIKKLDSQKKVLEIQMKLVGLQGTLVSPARRFVHQCEFFKQRNSKYEKRTLFIFNNLAVIAKKVNDGKYEFKDEIDLHWSWMRDNSSSTTLSTSNNHTLRYVSMLLVTVKKTHTLHFKWENERTHIMKVLNETMQALKTPSSLHPLTLNKPESLQRTNMYSFSLSPTVALFPTITNGASSMQPLSPPNSPVHSRHDKDCNETTSTLSSLVTSVQQQQYPCHYTSQKHTSTARESAGTVVSLLSAAFNISRRDSTTPTIPSFRTQSTSIDHTNQDSSTISLHTVSTQTPTISSPYLNSTQPSTEISYSYDQNKSFNKPFTTVSNSKRGRSVDCSHTTIDTLTPSISVSIVTHHLGLSDTNKLHSNEARLDAFICRSRQQQPTPLTPPLLLHTNSSPSLNTLAWRKTHYDRKESGGRNKSVKQRLKDHGL